MLVVLCTLSPGRGSLYGNPIAPNIAYLCFQIRLLKSSYWQMCEAAGGHSERVTILTSSVADFTHTHSQLARKARVLSGGADRWV